MKRIFKKKSFCLFVVTLVVIYLLVWFQVFYRQNKSIFSSVDDLGNHADDDSDTSDEQKPGCNCPSLSRLRQEMEDDSERDSTLLGNDTHDEVILVHPRYQKYTPNKFESGQAKMVLILAYQRVGSSFFGKIFDKNPDIFYVYEPLDSLYQAMYGTGSGYNIPSDITSLRNGSDRIIPQDEIEAVSSFLTDLLSCRLRKLPTEYFVHSFWSFLATFMPSWKPYQECLQGLGLEYGRKRCASLLRCPKRFGAQPWHTEQCKAKLWSNTIRNDSVRGYQNCMHIIREKVETCIALMQDRCQSTAFRAAKTVRATMNSVEKLINENPNLRIIHLLRDPRPVVASRMVTPTYQGLFARNSSVRESRLYCSIATRDLISRKQLELKYPGVFFEVLYEDFVKEPEEYAKSVYSFLDMKLPDALVPWLRNETRGAKRADPAKPNRIPKWKRTVTVGDSEQIGDNCQQFYEMVDYDFH